jgi:membrane-associated phospholipid phosphatase
MRTGVTAKSVVTARLAVGMLIFAAMTLTLAEISVDVVGPERGESWTLADAPVGTWLRSHGSPWLTGAMRVATSFGSPLVVTGIAVALALHMLWRRRLYWLAALVLSVPGGALVNRVLKDAVHRARPQVGDPLLTVSGYSFPSGHTLMASVLYGVVAAYVCAHTRDWRLRLLTVVSASVLTAVVGVSRVYLGAHYVSDVLGATAEGLAWLSLTVTAVYVMSLRSHRI